MNSGRDICNCIYEFRECENDLDCIDCEIANLYWKDIMTPLDNKIESSIELDLLSE